MLLDGKTRRIQNAYAGQGCWIEGRSESNPTKGKSL